MPTLAVGTRVRLVRDVERYPFFVAPSGAMGTVVHMEPGLAMDVRMDEHINGCEEWDNEVHWFDDDMLAIRDDLEVLEPVSTTRRKFYLMVALGKVLPEFNLRPLSRLDLEVLAAQNGVVVTKGMSGVEGERNG